MSRREALAAFVGLLMLVALALTWAITYTGSDESMPRQWFAYLPSRDADTGCSAMGGKPTRAQIEALAEGSHLSAEQTARLLRCFGFAAKPS